MNKGGAQMRDFLLFSDIEQPCGNADVRAGQPAAAEHKSFLRQAEADALRPDRHALGIDETAAAEPDRNEIGHAK